MKRKITLLLVAVTCVLGLNAQITLTQNFNATNSVIPSWTRINNSQPIGSTSWFMGNPAIFPSYNGADSAYFAANFFSTLGTGTINTWLVTPTLTLMDGAVLKFATRTTSTTVNPDRLQVYMSQAGAGTNVGNITSTGTFSTSLIEINPNLTTNGYPGSWTVYTVSLSGITGSVTGRIGFRYFVPNAGPTGTNSSYIGLDAVEYALPCANPTLSIMSSTNGICSGNTAAITATGATTYTWSNGSNSPSITVSPTTTTIYTLTASSIPNCNSTATIAISATLTPNMAVSDVTTCAGTAATLMASGATSYSWSTSDVTFSTVVTPTMNSTYTVTGFNGDCQQTKIVSVALGASLSVNASANQSLVCAGSAVSLTATGGSTYSWSPGTSTLQNTTVNPTVTTIYSVTAMSGTCSGVASVSVNVNALPTITLSSSSAATVCINSAINLVVNGSAISYSWNVTPLTSSNVNVTAPSTAGNYSYSVVGTNSNNCSSTATITRLVSLCTGIENVSKNNSTISVFPNPFNNELKISGINGKAEFYNSLGQLVLTHKLNGVESISTSEFTKGIYILKIYNEEEKLINTSKAIKN